MGMKEDKANPLLADTYPREGCDPEEAVGFWRQRAFDLEAQLEDLKATGLKHIQELIVLRKHVAPLKNLSLEPILVEPKWEETTRIHDWRNYIGEEMRDLWETFSLGQREAIYINAVEQADREEWD